MTTPCAAPRSRDPLGSRYQALRLARRFRQAVIEYQAHPPGSPGIDVAALLALHGPGASMGTLLLLLSLFCLMPVGGVGNVFGAALWLLAWTHLQGRTEMPLPRRVAHMRLNLRWSLWMLRLLARSYRQAGRWLRPRWPALQAPGWRAAWSGWIAVQAGVIFLPIPLGNTLPALSLMALGLGWLLKDGVMLWLSLLLGGLSLWYMVWLGEVTWQGVVWFWNFFN